VLLAAAAILAPPAALAAAFAPAAAVKAPAATVPALAAAPGPAATAAAPSRMIDVIDVDDHETQVDITLQFNCSLRYSGHTPTSEGPEVRLRLRPDRDCGLGSGFGANDIPTEIAPISGPRGIVTSARLESSLGGELTLTLTWAKPEAFVLAQGASARGLRIRLIRKQPTEKARILVTDRGDTASNFAVNLESQRQPFDPAAVELAGQRLQAHAFVSEVQNAGEKWYRLRAGPFDQRSVAESVLRAAAKDYPRAWLAVGDDSITTDPNAAVSEPPLPPVEPIGADAPVEPAARKTLLDDARKAMRARDYAHAVQVLTKLQRQPEFPERAQVQEMLGLARERLGEAAHAKAEYEEYLRRYPEGPAADRIRVRLKILRAAEATARTGGLSGRFGEDQGWRITGDASQLYRRDSLGTDLNGPLFATIVQNAVFTDADLFAHRDGERFAMSFRTNAGYEKTLIPQDSTGATLSNRTRVTTAFFDISDRVTEVRARVGRQTSTDDGIFGTFDGGTVSYQLFPSWTLRASAGMPVEISESGIDSQNRFQALALAYGPELGHWNTSLFVNREQFDGVRDRQAVGAEFQYFVPTRSLVSYVDYDTQFHSLNALVLLGTVQLPDRWQVTVDLERRNSPILTTRNALSGQTVTTLAELEQTFTLDQIFALAQDRTPVLSSYIVSAMKQLGERWQVLLDVFEVNLSATPASGGVEAFDGTAGRDISYQAQIVGSSLLRSGDFNQFVLRYDRTASSKTVGGQYIGRFPVFGAWRIGPRLAVQRRESDNGVTQLLYTPYLHLDYQRNGRLLEIEGGAELGRNPEFLQIGNTTRLFVSVGYRINF
jgi:hypothetical protein